MTKPVQYSMTRDGPTHVFLHEGKLIKTPGGKPIRIKDPTEASIFLEDLIDTFGGDKELDPHIWSYYSLYSSLNDFILRVPPERILNNLSNDLFRDWIFHLPPHPAAYMLVFNNWREITDYMREIGIDATTLAYWGLYDEPENKQSADRYRAILKKTVAPLSPPEKTCLVVMSASAQAMMPMLALIKNRITVEKCGAGLAWFAENGSPDTVATYGSVDEISVSQETVKELVSTFRRAKRFTEGSWE